MTTRKRKAQEDQQNPLPISQTLARRSPRKADYLRPKKTLRIALSGDVHVTQLELDIIDTPEFQRLRRIRQLGMTHLVYPTALHTRFDHALGTLEMVGRMLRAIGENPKSDELAEYYFTDEQEALARLYALLHDVTHVPFSHTIEDELSLFIRHDKNADRIAHFLGRESSIGRLMRERLGEDIYKRFTAIFHWDPNSGKPLPHHDEFIFDLVSNTVSADLLDYLARDSYFCNLDLTLEYRFLFFLYLAEDGEGCRRPFIRLWKKGGEPRDDTLTDLARLMYARYLLAERVYFHHTKLVTGAMLGRALLEAKLAGEITEPALWKETDESLLVRLEQSAAPVASRLARALSSRDLHKELKAYRGADFDAIQQRNHDYNARGHALGLLLDPETRRRIENEFAEEIDGEPGDVLLYCLPEDETNFKYADVNILWEGTAQRLSKVEHAMTTPQLDLTIKAHKRLWGVRLMVSPAIKADPRRAEMLVAAGDLEFLCPPAHQERKRLEFLSKLVHHRLVAGNYDIPPSAVQFEKQLLGAATELSQLARDRAPWSARLAAVLRKHFGDGADRA